MYNSIGKILISDQPEKGVPRHPSGPEEGFLLKIDLTCPVELWQYAMPTDERSECTFVMNNLSDKVVVSVQVTLSCYDQEDQLLFRQTERVQGLKAGVGERFSIVILPSQWDGVEGMDLVIEKVWFDDATIWRKGNAPLAVYTSNAIPAGRALDELRFVAGKDAVGYPQIQGEVWLCVCGRANAMESDRCCRCDRRRDTVLATFTRDNVSHLVAAHEQKLAETARKAREENNLLQENQEKKRAQKRRRRKKALRVSMTLLCLGAVAAAAVIWGVPWVRYRSAADLLRDGHYQQARVAFQSMGDYRDAVQQALECDYQAAAALLAAGDEASLEQAEEAFAQLGDYADSADQRREAAYQLGQLYLSESRFEEAAGAFQALGDYRDSASLAQAAAYGQAEALYESGNYTVARVLYAAMGDYEDAAEKVLTCGLMQGKALLNMGDYAGAVEELSALPDNEEAVELARQANYALAEASLAQEDYQTAGEKYLLAGDYSDAQAKANECLYRYAQQRKEEQDYSAAIAAFGQIADYLDSEGQIQDCVYQQARALANGGDYTGALAALDGQSLNQNAQELALQCHYQLGMAALEAGDMTEAESRLAQAGEYQDSVKQLRTVRYQLAEALYEQGSYADALAYYQLLDSYKSSAARRRSCRYEMAKLAMEQGDYATARQQLEELGSYKDSPKLLQQVAYQQALALEASQDYAGAAALYATVDGAEARERYNACLYAQALALRQDGALAAAGNLFDQLGSYQDAASQSLSCYEEYCGPQAETARAAMEQQDYPSVIAALEKLDLSDLAGAYKDLPEMYQEACYQYAEQLYRDGKPYEAMPYYERVGDYRDTADKKLKRRAYLILGQWSSTSGKTALFRPDGTCDLMGEELYFRVSNFSVYTGATPDDMTITHKLSSIDEDGMSLRDIRNGGDTVYKFTRVTETEAAPAEEETDAQP